MKRATLRPLAVLLLAITPLGGCTSTPADAPQDILAPIDAPIDISEDDDQIVVSGPALVEPRSFGAVTYDGSGEMVHPDAVVVPHGWNGHQFWFAATPYPLGNARYENPSFFQGDQADDWKLPAGASNPLAMPESNGYLSDPDMVLDAARGELRLYYRQTVRDVDQIYLMTTRNGRQWSGAQRVLEEPRYGLISPAIVKESDNSWRMWTVDARPDGCRTRASQIALSQRRSPDGIWWGPASRVQLAIPGRVPWHWDVQYIKAKGEYWALVAAYRDGGSCSESSLYFARSVDGTAWRVSPAPLLGPGVVSRLNDLIYRSTFRYFSKSDVVYVWYSGAWLEGGNYHFSLATARYPLAELLARVEAGPPAVVSRDADDRDRSAEVRAARAAFANAFP
jgi:hypothetical protein